MKQTQVVLLTVLTSAIAVSGQQVRGSGRAPADIVYGQPGQLVDVGGFRLNGDRLAHPGFRFRMGRLGASVVEGAATDSKVDARLQL